MPYQIPKHGGYKNLKSFQMSEIVFDFTFEFCKKYIRYGSRSRDQMEQAARSGKQNIGEGSQASAISPKTEIKLVDVARASLEELKIDYQDFLRTNNLSIWSKDDLRVLAIRKLAYLSNKSYETYRTYMTNRTDRTDGSNKTDKSYWEQAELAGNCALCLINQTNYLLDQQLESLTANLDGRGLSMESHEQKVFRAREEERKKEEDFDKYIKEQLEKNKKKE
ncbi:MAG: four helix bundle protein [Candidatus Paceibacterota bacterium]|jgi:four helix bundle protein